MSRFINPGFQVRSAYLTFARQQWGISQAQGCKLLKLAWTQIKNDVDETGIDRLELLAWSIQTLMAAAGQAKQQKNPRSVGQRRLHVGTSPESLLTN